uniref:Uncharacterized protein n=1 Tax=uncultured marine thaumarchaeote KM3_87_F05 TaxID=1456329 RepID=A0A075I119_9ARCH|nr:hypothetical protein [uncultured marine thaumarchaeote KM3_87_F05]
MMQDPNPLPWGAQDRFQAHFVVQQEIGNDTESWRLRRVARTRLKTTGHFGSKKIIGVTWEGGKLAEDLNADSSLNEAIANQSVNDATIFVDPTDNGIRIYGKWKNSYDFSITKELFDIYNNIAGYIKKVN